jgi:hypothetical protein
MFIYIHTPLCTITGCVYLYRILQGGLCVYISWAPPVVHVGDNAFPYDPRNRPAACEGSSQQVGTAKQGWPAGAAIQLHRHFSVLFVGTFLGRTSPEHFLAAFAQPCRQLIGHWTYL